MQMSFIYCPIETCRSIGGRANQRVTRRPTTSATMILINIPATDAGRRVSFHLGATTEQFDRQPRKRPSLIEARGFLISCRPPPGRPISVSITRKVDLRDVGRERLECHPHSGGPRFH